jgi:hypothetical protein
VYEKGSSTFLVTFNKKFQKIASIILYSRACDKCFVDSKISNDLEIQVNYKFVTEGMDGDGIGFVPEGYCKIEYYEEKYKIQKTGDILCIEKPNYQITLGKYENGKFIYPIMNLKK